MLSTNFFLCWNTEDLAEGRSYFNVWKSPMSFLSQILPNTPDTEINATVVGFHT